MWRNIHLLHILFQMGDLEVFQTGMSSYMGFVNGCVREICNECLYFGEPLFLTNILLF